MNYFPFHVGDYVASTAHLSWDEDMAYTRIIRVYYQTEKPIQLLQRLIALFTDPGEVVIDPCCGSGSTVIAATRSGRSGYGFEIKRDFHKAACAWLEREGQQENLFTQSTVRQKQMQVEMA